MPVLVALLGYGASNFTFTNNYRVFFDAGNPQLKALDNLERSYAQDDNLLLLLVPTDGEVFSKRTLSAVMKLTEKAWNIPYSIRVDSLSNFQHTEAEDDDLMVRGLTRDPGQLDEAELGRVRDIALSEPSLFGEYGRLWRHCLFFSGCRVFARAVVVDSGPGKSAHGFGT